MKKKISLLITGIVLSGIAHAETLASWDFDVADGPDPAPRSLTANAQSADINTAVVGMTDGLDTKGTGTQGWADVFAGKPWQAASLAAALTANEYLSITVTAQDGMMMSLTNLTIGVSQGTDAQGVYIFSSEEGFSAGDEIDSIIYTGSNNYQVRSLNLDATAHSALETVEFRLYFYGSVETGAAGIGKFGGSGANDLEVQGTTESAAQRGTLFVVK